MKLQTNYNSKITKCSTGKLGIGFCILFVIWCWEFGTYSNAYAQVVSSAELINKSRDYDGKTVVYQGEVIGDVMARGGFAWINLNDASNAIGVWIKKDLTRKIAYTGAYKTSGDVVEVTGVFHRSCLAHGGDLDIHAQSLRQIEGGNNLPEKLSPRRVKIAWWFGAMVIILWISQLLTKQRKQK